MTATLSVPNSIESWLGDEAEDLLTHQAKVSKDFVLPTCLARIRVDRIFAGTE